MIYVRCGDIEVHTVSWHGRVRRSAQEPGWLNGHFNQFNINFTNRFWGFTQTDHHDDFFFMPSSLYPVVSNTNPKSFSSTLQGLVDGRLYRERRLGTSACESLQWSMNKVAHFNQQHHFGDFCSAHRVLSVPLPVISPLRQQWSRHVPVERCQLLIASLQLGKAIVNHWALTA